MNNTFTEAIDRTITLTTNNMPAFERTLNRNVDLFFKIGASRGKDILFTFIPAFVENKELALRIAQWGRDVRGGAGERKVYRDILTWLEVNDKQAAIALVKKTPEVGRWDDLLVFKESQSNIVNGYALTLIADALRLGNGLCAKWMPRKGPKAVELRKFLNLSPKAYRKTLVGLTNVVETPMCANEWDNIDFNKLPSLASRRYTKAFKRHTPAYQTYIDGLATGVSKVSAAAVYPYDVLKGLLRGVYDNTTRDLVIAQWTALPNFIGDASVLPMVDTSGSMHVPVGNNANLLVVDVAVSLGLYFSEKNRGPFNGTVLTFSGKPELLHLEGNVLEQMAQLGNANWAMNTNLEAAFSKVLSTAIQGNVLPEDMPKTIVILSDMQFDQCVDGASNNAFAMIKSKYEASGYKIPTVVFWNLNAHDNVPVRFNEQGVALVSGFSPAIAKSVLSNNLDNLTPESIMMDAVMIPRYDIDLPAV